jgi:hypothetical protein
MHGIVTRNRIHNTEYEECLPRSQIEQVTVVGTEVVKQKNFVIKLHVELQLNLCFLACLK